MLTSNNQYIHADYLSPMPNALDAKNSPLALLAQTCSAIGSDAPNAKLVANMEKSAKSHASKHAAHSASSIDSRDKSSPNSHSSSQSSCSSELITAHQHTPSHITTHQSHYLPTQQPLHPQAVHPQPPQAHSQPKSSFKPYESTFREQRTPSSSAITTPSPCVDERGSARIRTPKSTSATSSHSLSQSARCESNQSASSQRASPSTNQHQHTINNHSISRKTPSSSMQDHHHSPSPHRASSKESTTAHHSSTSLAVSPSQASPFYSSSKLGTDTTRDSSVGYPKTSAPPISLPSSAPSPYYSGYSTPGGLPYPMDLLTASALMSPHHAMMKAAAMNPYLNYARLKGATDPMMPVCRDPYCTGCALSPHGASPRPPCPAGCTQCDHTSSKSYGSHPSHGMSAASHGSVAAAYAHAQLAALAAASQLPYVCNWIAGDTSYCGKRFGNSDELLQHLRTHTSTLSESMMNPATAAAAMAAAAGIPPNHPLFQRSYPTPPLSPLSSAARYHPYGGGKPGMVPTSSLGPPMTSASSMPPLAHPSLAQYFSPYSLYGPRIGQSHP